VVATLVRLRFLLLGNALKKSPWQVVAVVLGGLYGLGVLIGVVIGLVALSFTDVETARTVTVLAGGVVILGWILSPILATGVDQTVDPARLVTFPIPVDRLLVGLAVSGVLGVPGIVTSVAALATAATWWHTPAAAAAAVLCAAIAVLTCVAGSRLVGAVASSVGTGRRFQEVKGLVLFVPLVLLGPIIFWLTDLLRGAETSFPAVADAVALTPLGAIWAVPSDVAAGRLDRAALEFGIGVAFLAVLVVLWRLALARALETPARSSSGSSAKRGLGLFGVVPGTPAGAVAARALIYWVRDPRYAQALILVPILPLLFVFYAGGTDSPWAINAIGPGMAFLLAISLYTDVSYDNTAFALHVQTGVRGRDDLIGRIAAMAVFAVPVVLVATVATVWFTGSWSSLPGLLGIALGLLLSGFGLSSVLAARIVLEVPAPGESPFASKPGGGFTLMLVTMLTWGGLIVLGLPETVLAIAGFATGNEVLGWLALATGLTLGGVLLIAGVRIGGRMLDERGAELLAQLQKQK
jgi:ABC-2 type transport system permease protein